MAREVLLIGNDPFLLNTRAKILAAAGISARRCSPRELNPAHVRRIRLALLCHSITAEQFSEVVEQIRQSSPDTRLARVLPFSTTDPNPSHTMDELPPTPEEIVRYALDVFDKQWDDGSNPRRTA